jgi:hypothetical protein
MTNAEFTKLAIQFQQTDDIIKAAGIFNRLKNLFKTITNPQYREAVDKIRHEGAAMSVAAKNLNKHLEAFTRALSEGDVIQYKKSKQAINNALQEFLASKHVVDVGSEAVWKYTLEEYKSPGFIERYVKFHKEKNAEWDAEIGKKYTGKKLRDFMAFRNVRNLYIHGGEGKTATTYMVDYVAQSLSSMHDPKDRASFLEQHFNDEQVEALKTEYANAILLGDLISVNPRKPQEGEEVEAGTLALRVRSVPFKVPGIGAKVQATVTLLDTRPDMFMPGNISLVKTNRVDFLELPLSEQEPELLDQLSDELNEPEEPEEPELDESVASIYLDLVKSAGVDRGAMKRLSPEFWVEFVKMSNRIGARPEDIATVIMSESAFDPAATAVRGGRVVAKGLNQITKVALPGIGMSASQWDDLENMPAIQQLPWVEKYYKSAQKNMGVTKWNSATQLYIANFAPAHLSKANDPDAVLYDKYKKDGSLNPAYTMNIGLDRKDKYGNRRGHITIGDLTKSVSRGAPRYVLDSIKKAQETINGTATSQSSFSDSDVESLITRLVATPLTNIVKKAIIKKSLPKSTALVLLSSNKATAIDKIEFARVAASALRDIDVKAQICQKQDEIEINCSGLGSEIILAGAIQEVCDLVSQSMVNHTGHRIYATSIAGKASTFDTVQHEGLIQNCKKFDIRRFANVR